MILQLTLLKLVIISNNNSKSALPKHSHNFNAWGNIHIKKDALVQKSSSILNSIISAMTIRRIISRKIRQSTSCVISGNALSNC